MHNKYINWILPERILLISFVMIIFCMANSSAQPADIRVHDPVIIREDNTYYIFCTGGGITVWSSADLKNWHRENQVFEHAPAWTHTVVPDFKNHIWAPDISFHNDKYYLYYAISVFGKNTSAIGVATNKTLHPDDPDFKWVDHGPVIESVPGRNMWNAIDPNLAFDDSGTPWLAFGSYWLGLKIVKLKKNLTDIARSPQTWHTIAARYRNWKMDEQEAGDTENGDIEAPFIFKKNGYYYLFVSWDQCCAGKESTYKIVVGRSRKISGPYLDQTDQKMVYGGGTLVVNGNGRWAGVGHNAIATFDGVDYLICHGYDNSDDGKPKLIIRKISWEDGWPAVTL